MFFLVRITINKLSVEYLNIALIIAARSRNTSEAKNFLKCLTPDLEIKTVQGAISRHCLIVLRCRNKIEISESFWILCCQDLCIHAI